MKVKKFTASSVAACMEQVKAEMGERALIVHKREYDRPMMFGLFHKRVAEVTAAVDVEQQQKIEDLVQLGRNRLGGGPNTGQSDPPPRLDTMQEAEVPPPLAQDQPVTPALHHRRPPAGSSPFASAAPVSQPRVDDGNVHEELRELREMLRALSSRFEEHQPEVFGEPFDAVHRRLMREKVDRGVANQVVARISDLTLPDDPVEAEATLLDALTQFLPVAGPIVVPPREERQRAKVAVLVGPTGMGKTTTLAKIAAQFIVDQGLDVRFVTTDTYRMAAMDQLQRYVDIMNASMKVVYGVEEMAPALEAMQEADLILIDTAGCSQYNATQLNDLAGLLHSIEDLEVHLVLAANTRLEDMQEIVQRFGALPISRLLLTKLDETSDCGAVLSLAFKSGLPVSYLTTGQNVPEDIEIAESRRLAELVYGTRRLVTRDDEVRHG